MTCEEFAESLVNDGFFSEMNGESYWSQSFNSDRYFEAMKEEAAKKNITLSDVEEWDYDKFMYEVYKSDPDKGLS